MTVKFLKSLVVVFCSLLLCKEQNSFAQNNQRKILPGEWGDQLDGTYKNPVLMADYNNPEIIRVGDDFYLTAATHHFVGNPILHSKDLVNWTIVSRVFRRLDVHDRYNHPGQAYQHGSWAPTMVYHDNQFWYYFITNEEGVWLTKADNPEKDWSPLRLVKSAWGWDSPYPLWDDDGQCYMYRSFAGAGTTLVHRMACSGDSVLDQGRPVTLGYHQEGMKIFKKDGYYYMYGGGGNLYSGYNLCYRSKNPYGPYEKKIVLEQGEHASCARQGSLIELQNGEWWACHFGYYEGYGRIMYLEPVEWIDGWPMVGHDTDGNGIGEPVAQWKKPDVGSVKYDVKVPQSTFFPHCIFE